MIVPLLARIGQYTQVTWNSTNSAIQWDGREGNYHIERKIWGILHFGLMDAWNAKGQTSAHNVSYVLDNETDTLPEDAGVFDAGGGV